MGKAKSRRHERSDTDSDAIDARIYWIDSKEIATTSLAVTRSRSRSNCTLAVSTPRVEEQPARDNEEEEEKKKKKAEVKKEKTTDSAPAVAIVPQNLTSPMPIARALPLLICSIGNPGKHYANTLHSAGHVVAKKLQERLQCTPWQKSKAHGNGLVSYPAVPPTSDDRSDWTLWQSTSLMNISGKGVKAARDTWAREKFAGASEGEEGAEKGKLVILHDELEKPLGEITLNVRQGASAKGHNGLKSIMLSLRDTPFVRIGVGIGRPVSRERNDVADYVMRKAKPEELAKIEGSVEMVVAKLRELERGAG